MGRVKGGNEGKEEDAEWNRKRRGNGALLVGPQEFSEAKSNRDLEKLFCTT